MKPRHAGRGAEANSRKTIETSCSEAIEAATRPNSNEKKMRCLERVTTKAARPFEANAAKPAETGCSEAIAVAVRANSSEAEAKTWNETWANEAEANSEEQLKLTAARQLLWLLEPTQARLKPRHVMRLEQARSRRIEENSRDQL
jgi:hypothetical protein